MLPIQPDPISDSPEDNQGIPNKALAVIYWVVATGLLIISLLAVIQFTAPKETPAPTPNLTTTLQQALIEALGPPTDTPQPTLTQTPTLTFTPTNTPLPSLTPTITLTPTPTPTNTTTPLRPTLTPALPSQNAAAFELVRLSPEKYNAMIESMAVFPELLLNGSLNDSYNDAFYHAVVAGSEALLQYPDDPLSVVWRRNLAYDLARIGDDRSGLNYAALIQRAFDENIVTQENLAEWFFAQDQRVTISVTEIDPVPGAIRNQLLEIKTPGGSLFLWFSQTQEKINVVPLVDATNFKSPQQPDINWADLTEDGIDDLIISAPASDARKVALPKIFDISQTQPQEISFKADQQFEIGFENEYKWLAVPQQNLNTLQFVATVYPPCPVTISHTYQWTGFWLERSQENYDVQPLPSLLEFCELLVDQASSVWGYPAAIAIMEKILPEWPPKTTSGKAYPLDEYDEWRYRLGIYHALIGDSALAEAYFNGIIEAPVIPGSRWIAPARNFVRNIRTPDGLYRICVTADFCDPRLALANWVESLTPQEAQNGLYTLGSGGLSIRSTGQFDFEGDGVPERWFTFRHQADSRLEFWILVETANGAKALFVDTVENNQPTLTRYVNYDGQSYVWIGSAQSFKLNRYLATDQVSIELLPPSYYYSDYTNQVSRDSLNALLAGFYPASVRNRLLEHLKSDDFVCLNKEDCARYYFALGLASEFSGWEDMAIENYLKVWVDSFESPFATMVRLKLSYKLGFGPPPTATLTPTQTDTPTPTLTITPTPTSTGSITASATTTHTPDPNITQTPSQTASSTPIPPPPGTPYP